MVRPTKQQILRAAEMVVIGNNTGYACNALKWACGCYSNPKAIDGSKEFKKFFNISSDVLDNVAVGWFGSSHIEENQLARSLALLLYAEAINDVLVGKK